MNPIVKNVAKLMKSLREADTDTLTEAREVLQNFSDSWLVEGDNKDFPGAGDCCLSDTDLTTALTPVLEVWIDMVEGDE